MGTGSVDIGEEARVTYAYSHVPPRRSWYGILSSTVPKDVHCSVMS